MIAGILIGVLIALIGVAIEERMSDRRTNARLRLMITPYRDARLTEKCVRDAIGQQERAC